MTGLSFVALALSTVAWAQDTGISGERIRAHVKFLSSDLLEGRGVAVRGGDLATEYIASQFAVAGAKPAGDGGTYFQKVPLVGVRTEQARSFPPSRAVTRWPFDGPMTSWPPLICKSRKHTSMPRPSSWGTGSWRRVQMERL